MLRCFLPAPSALDNNPRGKSRFTCSPGSGISHSRAVFCYLHRLESPVSQGRINAEEEEYVTGDRQVRVRTATQSSVTSAQVSERQRVPFCIFTFRKVKYSVCTLKTFFIIVALITLTACNYVQVLFGLLLFLLMNTTALRKVFFFFLGQNAIFHEGNTLDLSYLKFIPVYLHLKRKVYSLPGFITIFFKTKNKYLICLFTLFIFVLCYFVIVFFFSRL